MKAICCLAYGPPETLQLKEVEKPFPKDDEILVRIFATAVNSGDVRIRKAEPWAVRLFFGFTRPRNPVLGGVLSGEVESVGKNVTLFKTGDNVFGSTGMSFGAYAEYKCLREDAILAIKPGNINHQQAAVIPFGGHTALHFLQKAKIRSGQKILIYGASGSVGSAAVQLAKYFGAEVTGVCSTSNLELVQSLGADKVIDYTKEDFTKNGKLYDIIFETVNKLSFSTSIRSLKPGGVLILGSAGLLNMLRGAWVSITRSRKVISGMIIEKIENMIFLTELMEAGTMTPVIDKTFLLGEIAEAHRYVEGGHKKGNVAIVLHQN
jgi:NADPH:quinone reductase-like Zn-dependent oxidoreductase